MKFKLEEAVKVAYSCKALKFDRPLADLEVSYSGLQRIDPHLLEQSRQEGFAEGQALAAAQHNAQVLEYREELQALHDEVLAGIESRFQELTESVAQIIPELVIEVAKALVPAAEVTAESVQAWIDQLVADHGGDEAILEVQLGSRDYGLVARLFTGNESEKEGQSAFKLGRVRITEDENLGPADCVMQSAFGLIDATVSTRLKHIQLNLLGT